MKLNPFEKTRFLKFFSALTCAGCAALLSAVDIRPAKKAVPMDLSGVPMDLLAMFASGLMWCLLVLGVLLGLTGLVYAVKGTLRGEKNRFLTVLGAALNLVALVILKLTYFALLRRSNLS